MLNYDVSKSRDQVRLGYNKYCLLNGLRLFFQKVTQKSVPMNGHFIKTVTSCNLNQIT